MAFDWTGWTAFFTRPSTYFSDSGDSVRKGAVRFATGGLVWGALSGAQVLFSILQTTLAAGGRLDFSFLSFLAGVFLSSLLTFATLILVVGLVCSALAYAVCRETGGTARFGRHLALTSLVAVPCGLVFGALAWLFPLMPFADFAMALVLGWILLHMAVLTYGLHHADLALLQAHGLAPTRIRQLLILSPWFGLMALAVMLPALFWIN